MLIVQRIRVRWYKSGRGAEAAARRRAVPGAVTLPPLPGAPVDVHDVLADQRTGYTPQVTTAGHDLPAPLDGLLLRPAGPVVEVLRTPVWAAYPRDRHPGAVFVLSPGDRARYRANFRCSGYSEWYYEQWTVNIAYRPWEADLFLTADVQHDEDERVSLYGAATHRAHGGPR